MNDSIIITCACGSKFRGLPEFKWNSTIKNKQPEECKICTNTKILNSFKSGSKKTGENKRITYGRRPVDIKVLTPKKKRPVKNEAKNRQKYNLEKQMDIAWSLLVKIKAGGRCEYCGKSKPLNSHHVFSRANKSVRWRVDNGVCLCVGHHIGVDFSAHKTPTTFSKWIVKKRGEQWHDMITLAAHSSGKYTRFEKEIILKELQNEVARCKIIV